MSEFEEIFGEGTNMNEDLSSFIATIRDDFPNKINHYIPECSMASSASCVLFAVYKLLENDLKEKEYTPYELQGAIDEN